MARDDTTKIAQDGLRHKSKEGGSPYGQSGSVGTVCLICIATRILKVPIAQMKL